MGKHNFKYIDSILLEWKKNNLRTPRDIEKYDHEFQYRKTKGIPKRKIKETSEEEQKKEFFKTLYMG